ncbi:MYXO-CTERM sorting domain-containing protein [Pendulispora albinea]|uniref:MYXO-CTERM sorting domain-containing protein n=1 Tax=Pendulispora albinea TaxID=2741071 RepID=A0ABZ2M003_9BACT
MAERSWMVLAAALAAAAATFVATPAYATICRSEADCAATPDTPACNKQQPSDPTGVCAQCSSTNVVRCGTVGTTRTPVCLTQYGICGCANDTDCGDRSENSGLICTRPAPANGSAPYCTAGCVNDGVGGRNGCPAPGAGTTCSATTPPNVGQCLHDCFGDSGVLCSNAGPRNVCQLVGGLPPTTRCVECTALLGGCAGKTGATVCDTDTNTCVQCNDNDDCAPYRTGTGPICRPGGSFARSCGCNDDSDCNAVAGRICDDTIKACVTGCRAGGGPGNNCPSGQRCNATGGGTGQCVPIDDGGTADAGDDGSAGDGSTGDDGSAGDGSAGDAGDDGGGIRDSGPDSRPIDAGRTDAGRMDAGGADGGNDGNYGTSLEGGGCSCSVPPAEDALPVGGLVAVGGFFAFFTRRRSRKSGEK